MFWFEDTKVDSFQKLLEVLGTIKKEDQAQNLLRSCVAEFGDVDAKLFLGYLLGYFKHTRRIELGGLLKLSHPIWGTVEPTVEQALRAGLATVRAWKAEMIEAVKFKEEEQEALTQQGALEQRKVRAEWNF